MREATILLVEGKGAGALSLAPPLLKEGFTVQVVHTGRTALEATDEGMPDLIVFDGSSMRSSGIRSCKRLRRHIGDNVPLIHSRPAGEALDREAGADIYLERPFTARKLLNRVRSLLPADEGAEEIVRSGHITLFKGKRSVDVAGHGEKRLTPKLAILLEEFLRHPNEIISRRQLMQNVWQTDYIGDTRTLDVHIRWARELIEENPSKPKHLTTVRGAGYIFRIHR